MTAEETKEEILANFEIAMLVNKQALSKNLDEIRPVLGIEIGRIITQTYREIWNMIQRKKGEEYSSLSIVEVDRFKHHGLEFKKIIIDKCAHLVNDECIEHLGIDFDLFPNRKGVINSINGTVDTLFTYTVYLLSEELKGNEMENRYIRNVLDFTKDENNEKNEQRLDTYDKLLFGKIDYDINVDKDTTSKHSMSIKEARAVLAKRLHEATLHKQHDDLYCAICGKKGGNLALSVIKYTQDRNAPFPQYFVPQSASGGIVRGCFPVCDRCAPPCKKCNLPRYTDKIKKLMEEKKKELHGDYTLMLSYGVCNHIQWGLFFKYLIKKILHIH